MTQLREARGERGQIRLVRQDVSGVPDEREDATRESEPPRRGRRQRHEPRVGGDQRASGEHLVGTDLFRTDVALPGGAGRRAVAYGGAAADHRPQRVEQRPGVGPHPVRGP
jgi:hypothetical protein